jgi:hypothetical protein
MGVEKSFFTQEQEQSRTLSHFHRQVVAFLYKPVVLDNDADDRLRARMARQAARPVSEPEPPFVWVDLCPPRPVRKGRKPRKVREEHGA